MPTYTLDPLGCWVLIEYWSISKVFKYIDMGNTPFPGMSNINESWKNNNKPENATEHSISDVFSGNNDASQQHVENVGPIPGGNYLIGNQGGGAMSLVKKLGTHYMVLTATGVIHTQIFQYKIQTAGQQQEVDLIYIRVLRVMVA